MKKIKQPICKRSDKGVIAIHFDNQEGKYISSTFPNSLDFHIACELEDPSQRYELIAYIEVGSQTERGYPLPGRQVFPNNAPSLPVISQRTKEPFNGRFA